MNKKGLAVLIVAILVVSIVGIGIVFIFLPPAGNNQGNNDSSYC